MNLPEAWIENEHWGEPDDVDDDCESPGAVLELTQCLSSLPPSEQGKTTISPQGIWKAASHSSEIRMHPDGTHFAVGNRGHDSLALFAVHQTTGAVELVGITPSGGACPRNFNWTCGGKYLVVGNQNSSTMCVFAFDKTSGALTPVHETAGVTSPNFVFPIPCSELEGLFTVDAPAA